MCLFSAATCTHNAKLLSLRANPLLSIRQRVASLTFDCNGVFAIKAYNVTAASAGLRVPYKKNLHGVACVSAACLNKRQCHGFSGTLILVKLLDQVAGAQVADQVHGGSSAGGSSGGTSGGGSSGGSSGVGSSAGVQVVNQVAGPQVVDQVAGIQVMVEQVAGVQVLD